MSTVSKIREDGPEAPPAETTAPHVLIAINSVMADISREGIAKDRKNDAQRYNFRGIDDVYNALAPILAKHRLIVKPRGLGRTCEERQTKSGGAVSYVNVTMEFDLISAVDGSRETAGPFYGEAMDSGDKATSKAQSAAFKYFAMQQFVIPTEGDNDPDGTTHQLASAEEKAISHLQSCSIDRAMFKSAWEANKDAWKNLLDGPAYARVVQEMKRIAATFPAEATGGMVRPQAAAAEEERFPGDRPRGVARNNGSRPAPPRDDTPFDDPIDFGDGPQ